MKITIKKGMLVLLVLILGILFRTQSIQGNAITQNEMKHEDTTSRYETAEEPIVMGINKDPKQQEKSSSFEILYLIVNLGVVTTIIWVTEKRKRRSQV
ncbi:MAG: hypothetical protein RR565_11015 [Erysipelothrix sp.]